MQTKLTLRLDDKLIAHAKAQARRNGKSLSQLVADYFVQLDAATPAQPPAALPPLVASLKGALKGVSTSGSDRLPDEADYRAYLAEKHR